ncbi:MAG: hypothetical protein HGB35_03725 [Geobacteraceae bacterium]|nr:hypothetical protein [Geobacteraceae bacterium]
MSINRVIIVLLQFILACSPLAGQAAALDHDKYPDQLMSIDRELFQECLKRRDSLRVKNHRVTLPRDRVQIHATLQQGNLLKELLSPEVIGHGSIPKDSEAAASQSISRENRRQENVLLKEFTAETSNP